MTGLLSAPSLPAPAVKKTLQILSEACLDSLPGSMHQQETTQPAQLPVSITSALVDWLSSEPFTVQSASKNHPNVKCCRGRCDKNICDRHTRPFTSLHVSLCASGSVKVNPGHEAERNKSAPPPQKKKEKTESEKTLIFSESCEAAAVVCSVVSVSSEAAVLVYMLHISRVNEIRTIQKELVLCVNSHLRRPCTSYPFWEQKKWVEN